MKEYYSLELVSDNKHLVSRNGKYCFEDFVDRPRIQNYKDVNLLNVNPMNLDIPEMKDGFEFVMYKKSTISYGELTHTSILETYPLVSVGDTLFAYDTKCSSSVIIEKEDFRNAINILTLKIKNLIALEQNKSLRNKTIKQVEPDFDLVIGEVKEALPKKLNPELILK